MGSKKTDRLINIPHKLWSISCELEGLGILFQNQQIEAPASFHYAEGLEGLGRICARNANRLRKLSRQVDEMEVDHAQDQLKLEKLKKKIKRDLSCVISEQSIFNA
jgi:hypothetical protein